MSIIHHCVKYLYYIVLPTKRRSISVKECYAFYFVQIYAKMITKIIYISFANINWPRGYATAIRFYAPAIGSCAINNLLCRLFILALEVVIITYVYLVRHAEADSNVLDQRTRPLTAKGLHDSRLITEFLLDKEIDVIVSSPYKRAIATVSDVARERKLSIDTCEKLCGLRIKSEWIDTYHNFFLKYWNDFNYHYLDGESFGELQVRSTEMLKKIVSECKDKTIIISTHSVSMAVIVKYYYKEFDFESFMNIATTEPFVVKLCFSNNDLMGIEMIDLFAK